MIKKFRHEPSKAEWGPKFASSAPYILISTPGPSSCVMGNKNKRLLYFTDITYRIRSAGCQCVRD